MSRRRLPSGLFALIVLWVAVASTAASALDVPYLTGRVVDTAEILSGGASDRISSILKAHEDSTTNQVAILTVPNLGDENIEDFALRVFNEWGLGRADADNGVLIVVAVQDRRMRIEVGYGLEPILTDGAAGRVIRDVMTPHFRDGDFDLGIEEGAQAVLAILEGRGEVASSGDSAPSSEPASGLHFDGPDLSLMERILIGAFIFGIIGLFTVLGVVTPGMGWFLYLFLIPFWAMFPIVVVGVKGAFALLIAYLVGFPSAKLLLARSNWYRRAAKDLKAKGEARIGGFTLRSGGGSGSRSGGGSWSSGGGGFSGGGGSSGGGGASGSW